MKSPLARIYFYLNPFLRGKNDATRQNAPALRQTARPGSRTRNPADPARHRNHRNLRRQAYDIGDFTEPPFFTLGARLGYLAPVGYYGAESRGDLAGGLRLGWVIDIPADLSLNVVYAAPALQDVDYAGEEDVLPRQRG